MSLASVAGSSATRQSKTFAIRSFPPLCAPATTAEALPEASGNVTGDQKSLLCPLDISPLESTSCDPGSGFLSYRGKIFKRPIAYAIRKFPKGCGRLTVCIPKPSAEASMTRIPEKGDDEDAEMSNRKSSHIPDFVESGTNSGLPEGSEAMIKVEEMEQKLNDVVMGIPKERSASGNISENDLIGKLLGGNDGEKPNCKSSVSPDFVRDGESLCRHEGSEPDNRIETMEEGLTEVVRRTSKERSGLGKVFKKSVVKKALGGKDGEKPDKKSSLTPDFVKDDKRFYSPEGSESEKKVGNTKEKSNNAVRKNLKERIGLGKILVEDVVGRSLGEKDVNKPNRKRSLMPDLAEKGGSEGAHSLEVRGDRLIVLALMAAERCPWMQGKGKGSVGLQSRQKKPRRGDTKLLFQEVT